MTHDQEVRLKAYLTEDPDSLVIPGAANLAAAITAERYDAIAEALNTPGKKTVIRKIISAKTIINEIAATIDYQSMGADAVMRLLAPLLIGGDTYAIGDASGGKAINNAISALPVATAKFNELKAYEGSYLEVLLGQGETVSGQDVSDAVNFA